MVCDYRTIVRSAGGAVADVVSAKAPSINGGGLALRKFFRGNPNRATKAMPSTVMAIPLGRAPGAGSGL